MARNVSAFKKPLIGLSDGVGNLYQWLMQCTQFFRRAHFCKKTGVFWTKIRASDGLKDGQNSGFIDSVVIL